MKQRAFAQVAVLLAVLIAGAGVAAFWPGGAVAAEGRVTQGQLLAADDDGTVLGVCPLEHTDVKASVSGFLSRVTVTQTFTNPYEDPIEAVYTFPLPQAAAVDRMTMKVGDRVIVGVIKRREEARKIYDAAKAAGKTASLLDQERPNIFTQAVANILPGSRIQVEISYVETLAYENGAYRFVFPTVVGPRYIPGAAVGKTGGGRAPDTDRVPDASRITPPVAAEGTRAGHDIAIEVAIDAGVPLRAVRALAHDVEVKRAGASGAVVRLTRKDEIPNRDFVLDVEVAGDKVEDALLTHRSADSGYFTFILQPPARVAPADVTPKELVFVLDTSGSMSGFPIEKAKEAMGLALDGLYPEDTFNLITFAGDTHMLFPQPVRATAENLAAAQRFLASRAGSGGTEMMTAIRAALEPSDRQEHVRIVCFMTDGYVGNDMEILGEIRRHPNARVFSFGIGSSVNRFLLDKMAEEGRGEVEYVALTDDGSTAARRFHERIRSPLLTDVEIDWGGLPVADVSPERIPDVFSAKPVVITGRFTGAARGAITLKGRAAGKPFERRIAVDLPERRAEHDVLAKLWARTRIDDLMRQDYGGAQGGAMKTELQESITQLGLEHSLMTQFTSFVAVEERVVTEGGTTRTVQVPVEVPEGVDRSMVIDEEEKDYAANGMVRQKSASGYVGGVAARPSVAPVPPALQPETAGDSSTQVRRSDAPQAHEAKADPQVRSLLRMLADGRDPSSAGLGFVREGRARVRVAFIARPTREALQKLGLDVVTGPDATGAVVAWVRLDRLRTLVESRLVRTVTAAP